MAAYFATASLMGTSNDDVNWRQVFIFLGLTGIALAVIVKLVIREPARGAMEFEEAC
jgi:FtsH-binding integral membrane protein